MDGTNVPHFKVIKFALADSCGNHLVSGFLNGLYIVSASSDGVFLFMTKYVVMITKERLEEKA